MDTTLLFFLAAVALVGVLLLGTIFITRKGPRPLDVEKYRSRWMHIEHNLNQSEKATYAMAILNADKLLDQALQDKGCGGKTTAERMKVATSKWSDANAVWTAHKTRNKIAHEQDFSVSFGETRRTLDAFKKALKELGAL